MITNDHIIRVAVEKCKLKPDLVVAIDTRTVYRHTKIPIGKKRKRNCSDIRTVIRQDGNLKMALVMLINI